MCESQRLSGGVSCGCCSCGFLAFYSCLERSCIRRICSSFMWMTSSTLGNNPSATEHQSEDKTVCGVGGPAIFLCPECGDCLSSQDYLAQHMLDSHAQKPRGRLECSYCPYTSNTRSHMTRHQRTHTDERPFSCPSCNQTFRQKIHLVKHQSIHTGEKSYKCTICGRQFRENCALSSHKKLHLDVRKPHACRLCGRSFRLRSALTRHFVTHTGERLHACRVCGQKFTQAGSARQHERQMHCAQI